MRNKKEYLVMPENCRWHVARAYTAEMAYRSFACWIGKTPTAVMDMSSGETRIFKGIDSRGQLID